MTNQEVWSSIEVAVTLLINMCHRCFLYGYFFIVPYLPFFGKSCQ